MSTTRVETHHRHQLEYDPVLSLPNLNIFVACFTTCWTCLSLYEALDLLQERVLYFDAESMVFRSLSDQVKPQLGNHPGDFKNELSDDDFII